MNSITPLETLGPFQTPKINSKIFLPDMILKQEMN